MNQEKVRIEAAACDVLNGSDTMTAARVHRVSEAEVISRVEEILEKSGLSLD